MRKSGVLAVLGWVGRRLRRSPLARSKLLNRWYARIALRAHGSPVVELDGFRIHYDPRDEVIAKHLVLHGGFERGDIDLLTSFVRPGEDVMDVGANIGLYSLYLSRSVGEGGRVFSVEPDPDNLELLRRNLQENGCTNAIVCPCALGAEDGPARLYQDPTNRGALGLEPRGDASTSVTVQLRRASEVLAEHDAKPEVIKMDVEGAEPLVFAGLGYRPRVMLLEFGPGLLAAFGRDPEEWLRTLEQAGYSLEFVHPYDARRIPVTSRDALERMPEARRGCCNLLALRGV
ncbi:MAG: FkbM family methyltransferase [Planctomycetota bacterium]|nr:FkbM family methyltransferase [Planctomycetota bacterium]